LPSKLEDVVKKKQLKLMDIWQWVLWRTADCLARKGTNGRLLPWSERRGSVWRRTVGLLGGCAYLPQALLFPRDSAIDEAGN